MIIGINESKVLTKHISSELKCKFDEKSVIQINCGIMINIHVSVNNICEKDYIWNPATYSCENRKYLASIMEDSVITCDKTIEEKFLTNFNKKIVCKTQDFYSLLTFFINYNCFFG